MTHVCKARRHNDQLQCAVCALAWDVNDPEPPKCKQAACVTGNKPLSSPRYPRK